MVCESFESCIILKERTQLTIRYASAGKPERPVSFSYSFFLLFFRMKNYPKGLFFFVSFTFITSVFKNSSFYSWVVVCWTKTQKTNDAATRRQDAQIDSVFAVNFF